MPPNQRRHNSGCGIACVLEKYCDTEKRSGLLAWLMRTNGRSKIDDSLRKVERNMMTELGSLCGIRESRR